MIKKKKQTDKTIKISVEDYMYVKNLAKFEMRSIKSIISLALRKQKEK